MKPSQPIVINLLEEREQSFHDTEELKEWLEKERDAWPKPKRTHTAGSENYYYQIINQPQQLIAAIDQYKASYQTHPEASEENLRKAVSTFNSSGFIPSHSVYHKTIIRIAKDNKASAGSLIAAVIKKHNRRNSATDSMSVTRNTSPNEILDILLEVIVSLDNEPNFIERESETLKTINKNYNTLTENIAAKIADFTKESHLALQDEKKLHSEQIESAKETLSRVGEEWESIKKTLFEDIALQAPATYWEGVADSANKKSLFWGGTFLALAFISILSASYWISRHLESLINTGASILQLVSLAIPAFGAIWILKIIAKNYSDNQQISRDADERVTMVKTFLALSGDSTTQKPMITDEDRGLILNALFRQSVITHSDDSPPSNLLDALLNRIAHTKR